MKSRKWITALSLLFVFMLSACVKQEKTQEQEGYSVYYVYQNYRKIDREFYHTDTPKDEREQLVVELLGKLSEVPEKVDFISPLGGNVELLDYQLRNDVLNLNFSEKYREQEIFQEILCRAAIVRTMSGIDGLSAITFSVDGVNLTDGSGNPIGAMTAETFIDNAGREINAYEKVDIRLFFSDEKGEKLVEVVRTVVYNTNISMEKLVMEQLIKGPDTEDDTMEYPTINPATKLLGVTVKDGVCYVNVDENFLNQTFQTSAEVAIYSVVNSLIELPNVNKVQLSINGETNTTYREEISLSTVFERNLDLVKLP